MDQQQLKEVIAGWNYNAEFVENRQNLEVIVTPDKLSEIANNLSLPNQSFRLGDADRMHSSAGVLAAQSQ